MKVLLLCLLLAGCITAPHGSFCDGHPIRLPAKIVDQLTDAQVADVLTHNKTGAKLCGWKP